LNDRLVEHPPDRAGQGLGPVKDRKDGPGDVQAAVAQPGDQISGQGGVLGRALLHRQRVLRAVDADAQRHHAGGRAEVHAVDQERDQVQVIEPLAHQLHQGGLGGGGEPARHRRLAHRRSGILGGMPCWLQAAHVTAGRQPGQHLLQRELPEDLGGGNRS
jgi:hypothetical protein